MMKLSKRSTRLFFFALVVASIFSCNYYVNHNLRKTYTDVNEFIHSSPSKTPFFKIHLKNGNVSVFDTWALNTAKDSILGQGKLYDFNRNQLQEGNLAFDIEEIAIIETNQRKMIESKDNGRIAALALLTIANVALDAHCISNPKACFGSCPTFYVEGQSHLHSASAEGFSSSISPCLEKRDLDALQYSSSSGEFFITMKNEAYETHLVNELLIEAVSKKKNEKVYHDKYGIYYRCEKLYDLKNAIVDGKEIGDALKHLDESEYFSPTDSFDLSSQEEIILEFDHLPKENLGIVINYRQTLLTTFLLYSGLSYMGNEVGDYFAKMETSNQIKKRLGHIFKRLGNIKLSIWDDKNKSWKRLESLYETGPIAKNLMLVPLSKIKPRNGKLKLKIELAKGLWRLDYLALTSIHSTAKPYLAYPREIEVIDGEEYSVEELRYDDKKYLLSFPGNEYRFKFDFPEIASDREYELFLSAKGYYLEWIREEWINGKNLPKLKKMLLNDDQIWKELAIEFKMMESEMETVFWNSKYSNIQ